MEQLTSTVQRITGDLNELMRQLSGTDDTQARELIDQLLSSDVLGDFKTAVDSMRNLLWIYIEAVLKSGGSSTLAQSKRLQTAVDLLRALHTSPVPDHFAGPETFFEHVQSVVDSYAMRGKKHDAA